MANPQPENGYTRLAHQYLQALCRAGCSGSEYAVALCILRLTWGWKKKMDTISAAQISEFCRLPMRTTRRALSVLKQREIIKQEEQPGLPSRLGPNKDYDGWLPLPKVAHPTPAKSGTGAPAKSGTGTPAKSGTPYLFKRNLLKKEEKERREKPRITPERRASLNRIFDHWQSHDALTTHREFTAKMQSAVNARLNGRSEVDICKAITRYAELCQRGTAPGWNSWGLRDLCAIDEGLYLDKMLNPRYEGIKGKETAEERLRRNLEGI